MIDESLCPHCGSRNPPGSNFCNRCGAALAGDLEPPAEDPAAPLADPAAPLYGADFSGEAAGEAGAILPAGPVEDVLPDQGAVIGAEEPLPDEPPLAAAPAPGEVEAGARSAGARSAGARDLGASDALDGVELVLFPDEQLLGGGQGYLESVAISGEMAAPAPPRAGAAADSDHWRTLRALMREEPALATALAPALSHTPTYRQLWIVLLLLAAALLPFGLEGAAPFGAPQRWPGVAEAYDQISRLQVDDEVLVFWQYDPATAGEMDVLAEPIISHLLDRSARSIVVTLLPGGLASARRLYANAVAGLDESALLTVLEGWEGDGVYLTGGTAALPLIARDTAQALSFAPTEPPQPRLAIVIAANADDAQQWLEIVQPRNELVTVAVTSAAADPVLRPYLESRQLGGLVSGFDGAASYQALRAQALSAAGQRRQTLIVDAQNWGAVALLLIVLAGNLARLFWRDRRG